ncbi:hypothetical protein VTI74DRAFT_5168 [Chaetomium olivicolor]
MGETEVLWRSGFSYDLLYQHWAALGMGFRWESGRAYYLVDDNPAFLPFPLPLSHHGAFSGTKNDIYGFRAALGWTDFTIGRWVSTCHAARHLLREKRRPATRAAVKLVFCSWKLAGDPVFEMVSPGLARLLGSGNGEVRMAADSPPSWSFFTHTQLCFSQERDYLANLTDPFNPPAHERHLIAPADLTQPSFT